jgi:hypothetical protein
MISNDPREESANCCSPHSVHRVDEILSPIESAVFHLLVSKY